MKSYLYEIPPPQLGFAVRQPKVAEIPPEGRGDYVDCGQLPLRYRTENPYGWQMFRHLIATVLLVAISVVAWLSLLGLAA